MTDDWQDISTAPKNEPVLVCPTNCEITVAIQELGEVYDPNSGDVPGPANSHKPNKVWVWRPYLHGRGLRSSSGYECLHVKPQMWRPLPLPPKHLYERKLTADLLEKQVRELRGPL
jgi:hypothetical protein